MGTNYKTLSNFTRYTIYDNGKVFDSKLNTFISYQVSKDGYCKVTLRSDEGNRKTFSIHRLVALCFIENPYNKPTVNHIDGNKLNNFVSNLEWATRSEQTQHAWDNNLITDMDSRKLGIRSHQGKRVQCENTGEVFLSLGEACEKYNLKRSNLSKACLKLKNWKTCGKLEDGTKLTWRFYD